jgi:hypothetical protein
LNTASKSGTKKSDFEVTDIPHVRDFFASSALSVLGNLGMHNAASVAQYCYLVADAMLIEREKHATTK